MTSSQLRRGVEKSMPNYFSRETMRFFGDTMKNYGVRTKIIVSHTSGRNFKCWELYRKKPVKHDLSRSDYFTKNTFRKINPSWKEVKKEE